MQTLASKKVKESFKKGLNTKEILKTTVHLLILALFVCIQYQKANQNDNC